MWYIITAVSFYAAGIVVDRLGIHDRVWRNLTGRVE